MVILNLDSPHGRLCRPSQETIDQERRQQTERIKLLRDRLLNLACGPKAVGSVVTQA